MFINWWPCIDCTRAIIQSGKWFYFFIYSKILCAIPLFLHRRDGRHSHLEINFPNLDGMVAAEVLTLEACFGHVGLIWINNIICSAIFDWNQISTTFLIGIKSQQLFWLESNLFGIKLLVFDRNQTSCFCSVFFWLESNLNNFFDWNQIWSEKCSFENGI